MVRETSDLGPHSLMCTHVARMWTHAGADVGGTCKAHACHTCGTHVSFILGQTLLVVGLAAQLQQIWCSFMADFERTE